MEQHHKPINDKIYLYILKTIMVLSFLLICSINQDGLPVFIYLLMVVIEFFNSFNYSNIGINWEAGLLPILVMGTLIVFCSNIRYGNFKILLLCFIALLFFLISESGMLNIKNYISISYGFLVPIIVFILTSTLLIIKVFKIKEKQ
ncbi:MAG: hypothetical protein QM564_12345 [Bergeyella sp.]